MVRRIGIATLAVVLSSCSVYREVEVHQVQEVRFKELSADGLDLLVYLEVENPNWYTVRLTESDIQLFLEGQPLGTVSLREPMILPRKSRSVQPMSIHASTGSLDRLLGRLFSLIFQQTFEVTGKGYVRGKAFLVMRKVDVSFTHRLERKDLGF